MFSRLRRRDPVGAVAVGAEDPADRSSPRLPPLSLSKALKQERKYFNKIFVQIFLDFALVVGTFGAVVLTSVGATAYLRVPFAIPFAISPRSGVDAFALLAAIIIALQVSVRSESARDDPNKALGRQFVIESASRLTALAAFTIVVGVWLSFESINLHTIVAIIPFLAAAALLAGLAADAAVASEFRFGRELSKQTQMHEYIRLRSRLEIRLRTAPTPATLLFRLSQSAGVLLFGSAASAAIVVFLGFPDGTATDWVQAFGFLVSLTIFTSTLMFFAKQRWALGDTPFATYLWLLTLLTLVGDFVVGAGAVTALGDDGLVQRLMAFILAAGITTVQPALLTGRVPGIRRGLTESLAFASVTQSMRRRLDRIDPRRDREAHPDTLVSIKAVLAVVVAVIFPPAGVALGLFFRRLLELSAASRRLTLVAIVLGTTLTAALTVVLLVLAATARL